MNDKKLHDLTEDKVIELLTIAELMDDDICKNNDDDIDFAKEEGMWSKGSLVGDKFLFFKNELNGVQQIDFLIKWEHKGHEDTDYGIHPYNIKVGFVFGMFSDTYKTLEVIEWFLKEGFAVGKLQLKSS